MSSVTRVYCDRSVEPIAFAARELATALRETGQAVEERPLDEFEAEDGATEFLLSEAGDLPASGPANVAIADASLDSEGFLVRSPTESTHVVVGGGDAGTMYGGLELAERVRIGWDVAGYEGAPDGGDRERRGLKLNFPLDARTPSYDDSGDAAAFNYETMWEFEFWREYLDAMARHRYNALTLWIKHPFPSLVEVPEYPDVALDDVYVPRVPGDVERQTPTHRIAPEVPIEMAIEMPIEEKIAFWRRVFGHARDRGIDVYLVTWNVCIDGTDGKYGITNEVDNDTTVDYLRRSVRELLLTYPELTGIGTTAGENMADCEDEAARENWLWRSYGRGVVDAKAEQPDRTVRFIHRVHRTDLSAIEREFVSNYPGPVALSHKYARAHVYSSPSPPFADDLVSELETTGFESWWNLRNDDAYAVRWGDPDYVREFLVELPSEDVTAGYHYGSDGYVWGRTFADIRDEGRLELEKHWYAFLLWGRLGYDGGLSRERFTAILSDRFPDANAERLYDAWQSASRVVPAVNRVHWRDWDYLWYPEGCQDAEKFHSVRDFAEGDPMPGAGVQSIQEFVAGDAPDLTSPVEIAEQLDRHADDALDAAADSTVDVRGQTSRELGATLDDVRAVACLGRYYAAKIRGAVALRRYETGGDEAQRDQAVESVEASVSHWEEYARIASSNYRPQKLARAQWLNWWGLSEDVRRDVEIAKNATPEAGAK